MHNTNELLQACIGRLTRKVSLFLMRDIILALVVGGIVTAPLVAHLLYAGEPAPSRLLGPYTASSNFSVDLWGETDTRVATWGRAAAQAWSLTFKPPAGYRVRILKLRGDLVAWPRVLDGEAAVKPGRYAGVLLGFQTTGNEGSARCDLCADNTMVYLQGGLSAEPVRLPFDAHMHMHVRLEADHKLVVKVASWLNTTGYPIHVEPTFTVEYQFERENENE